MKSSNSKCVIGDQSGYTDIQVKVQRSTAELLYEACEAIDQHDNVLLCEAVALTDAINIYIAEYLAVKAGLETALAEE